MQVMDFILVDWPYSLIDMIRTNRGRALLRRFAEDAENALECALDFDDSSNFFRFVIRLLWKRRAQRYFDVHNTVFPYVFHYYTMDHRIPYTYGCTKKFLRFRNNLNTSDPFITCCELNRTLSVHPARSMFNLVTLEQINLVTLENMTYSVSTREEV